MPKHQHLLVGLPRFLTAFAAVLAIPLAIAPPTLDAQQLAAIEGTVATKDGTPLASADVAIIGLRLGAVTDASGHFRITGVAAGPQRLVARRVGFGADTVAVTVPREGGGSIRVNFTLGESALRLSDMVVTATREQERKVEIPAAVGIVDGAQIRNIEPGHPSDIMNTIPGVYVRVTNGEGHMTAIRQPISGDPVYLYLEDGIPTRSTGFFNHNALYEVNLPQADRIEVTKGPGTALYGSEAIGGVVNVSTRPPSADPDGSVSLEGGRYNWARLLATGSNTWGGTGLRADLNLSRTNGWRDSTAYTRQSGTLRWDQRLSGTAWVKTVATFSHINQESEASSISLNDYLNNPSINYSPFAIRQVRAFRYSMAFEQDGASHSFSVTPYARYDWMHLIPNWTITYDPSDWTTQNKSIGAQIKYRRDFEPFRTRVIVGGDVDVSPGSYSELQMVDTRGQGSSVYTSHLNGTTLYDYNVTFHGISQYVQLETSPLTRLRLDLGLRADESGYDYTNNLTPLSTGRWRRPANTTVSYQHVSPKAGATYEFAEELNVFASHRNGFRAPDQGQLFRQGSALNTVGLQPVKVNSTEAGVRGRIAKRVDYDVAVYDMVKTDDILGFTFPDGHSETQNAGKTTHRGVETALGIDLISGLRFDVAYSHAKHTYTDWKTAASVDLSGKEIVSAPQDMGTATLTLAPAQWNGARLGAEVEHLGSYWEDQANTHQYPGYTLVHLRASALPVRGFVLSARLMNVGDKQYSTLSSYTQFNGEQFAPGQRRRLYITTEYRIR